MDGPWLISYVALWALTICLAVVILAHSRLLGLLHQRLGPAGARPLADGPDIGARLGSLKAHDLHGAPWIREFPAPDELLLVFVSPQCQTCNELIPHLKDYRRTHGNDGLVLVSTMDDAGMNEAYSRYRGLDDFTYLLGEKLSEELEIEATPYALRVSAEGIVTAKGIVNTYENLRALSTARQAPMPTKESIIEMGGTR